MKKKRIILLIILLVVPFFVFFYLNLPTSSNVKLKKVTIPAGYGYSNIGKILKENNLIKSELTYRIYVKFKNPSSLKACIYYLSENMGVSQIVKNLEKGCNQNSGIVNLTIPEGKHLEQVATITASVINSTKEEIMEVWNSTELINEFIEKYEFLTDEIKNSKIRYPLEGYLFPSTYELLNNNVTPKYVAEKMLDQMEIVYNKYKEQIQSSDYTFHELLTMASIVEYEAILDEERPIIAGIFYKRLNTPGWKFESCATLGYALGEWKLNYTYADVAVNHPYNTYYYAGFPPGPGNMPSEKSIIAAIKPQESDYWFFLANVCDAQNKRSIFAKTNAEHEANKDKYLCR